MTPYAISKVASEEALDQLADDDFSPVFLRPATAYGMSPRLRFDLVANNLTAWAVATGQVRLKSDGTSWRPMVHAEDMALAYLIALKADRALVHRQAFNVGSNEDCMTIRDLAKRIHEAIPGTEVTFAPTKFLDSRTYNVDFTKLLGIGYRPRWTLQRGIVQLREHFAPSA